MVFRVLCILERSRRLDSEGCHGIAYNRLRYSFRVSGNRYRAPGPWYVLCRPEALQELEFAAENRVVALLD
jgi:hypothetical protein